MRAPRRAWEGRVVLVTGIGGFVGCSLASELLARGAYVVGIVRDGRSLRKLDLVGIRRRVELVSGDVADLNLVQRAVGEYEVDAIFHLAAQTSTQVAARSPASTMVTNVGGTWNVLEAARMNPLVRSVVVASVADDAPRRGLSPRGLPPYEASKACCETLARSYAASFPLPVACVRCASVYGPCDTNWDRLVPGVVRDALAGKDPLVPHDWLAERDYIFISDAVEGYLTAAERLPEISGTAVSLGAKAPTSTAAMVEMILAEVGDPGIRPRLPLNRAHAPIGHDGGHGPAALATAPVDTAGILAGWRPRVPLPEGIALTVGWYRDYLTTGRVLALDRGFRSGSL